MLIKSYYDFYVHIVFRKNICVTTMSSSLLRDKTCSKTHTHLLIQNYQKFEQSFKERFVKKVPEIFINVKQCKINNVKTCKTMQNSEYVCNVHSKSSSNSNREEKPEYATK